MWSMADFSCLRTFEGHTASVLCCRFISQGTQILSGSADGLVRLWDVRSGECVNTFDKHEDKIWAIAVPRPPEEKAEKDEEEAGAGRVVAPPPPMEFYSGGSDARILTWVDSTKEEEDKRLEETERYLLQEQQMINDIRNKRFGKVRPTFIPFCPSTFTPAASPHWVQRFCSVLDFCDAVSSTGGAPLQCVSAQTLAAGL
jgi:U3 small nucleolar RNA-associated protein 13